jgi:tetratricopeptide (TPR) repeat protein
MASRPRNPGVGLSTWAKALKYRALLWRVHARIAAAIEQLNADRLAEQVERLAHHALRGEVWDKAVAYLRQAGAKAATRAANREAVLLLEQALVAVRHWPEGRPATEQGIDLRLDLRPPLLQLGQLERALQLSQEAEAMAEKLGDDRRLARVYTYLINYHHLKGDPELAVEYGERCLRIGEAVKDSALEALARGYLGYSYHAQARYRRAELVLRQNADALESAWSEAEGTQAGIAYVTSSGWLAFTLAERGDFDAATDHLDRALRAAEAAGHAYTQTIARTLAGLFWLRRGQLDRALPLLQKSLDACREKNLDVWRLIPSSLLGLTLIHLDRMDEGLRLLEDSVSLTEGSGSASISPSGPPIWAKVCSRRGSSTAPARSPSARSIWLGATRSVGIRRGRCGFSGTAWRAATPRRWMPPSRTMRRRARSPRSSRCARCSRAFT